MPHVYLKQQVKRCKNTSPINRNITKEGIQCWSLNALELIAIEIGASLETLFVSLSVASDSHDNFALIHTQAQRLFGKRRATIVLHIRFVTHLVTLSTMLFASRQFPKSTGA